MKITKLDKARVIIQALYNLDELPKSNTKQVVKFSKYNMEYVNGLYENALNVLNNRVRKSLT